MSPLLYLIVIMAVFAGVIGQGAVRSRHCRNRLRALAHEWNMHFAPGDRLRLAQRVAGHFPVPGAANIRVRDLFFRTDESRHQYLFTVDYTVGVIRGKVGRSCVAGFQEPVSHHLHHSSSLSSPELVIEPLGGTAVDEAYKRVMSKLNGVR